MASIKFIKETRRWRVWWHITAASRDVDKGSKTFHTKPEAEKFAKELKLKEQQLKADWYSPIDMPLSMAIEQWLPHTKTYAETTQYLYRKVLTSFAEMFPNFNMSQLSPRHINTYLDTILSDGLTARYYNCQLTAIRSFCKYMSINYNTQNPAKDIKKLREVKPHPRFLTAQEYKQALKSAGNYECHIIFIANTGLRVREFISLTWKNVHKDLSAITFLGKQNKQRTVPLNPNCKSILKRIKNQSAPVKPNNIVFLSKAKKSFTRHHLYQQFQRIGKQAELDEGFGPHALRHFFATQLLLNGVPIIKVSLLLGHASVTTTQQHYAHILSADLSTVTDVLTSL